MYKIGDTLVCICDFSFEWDVAMYSNKKGNKYRIRDIRTEINKELSYCIEVDKTSTGGLAGIWFNSVERYHKPFFSKHFISLAEWRDKQIESILND